MKTINKNISIDNVVFGFDSKNLNVLLVERTLIEKNKTVFSDLTLIGNHIHEHEGLNEAAARVLHDLTGLKNVYLEQFQSFADPDRLKNKKDRLWLQSIGMNPDNRVVTIGYLCLLNCEDVNLTLTDQKAAWHSVYKPGNLGFDHKRIIDEALKVLRNKMLISPVGFELLPKKFTLSQLQSVYEEVFHITLDKRNFRRKTGRMKYLVPMKEKQKGVTHKPAQLYMFSRDIYENTSNEFFNFLV